MPGIDKPKPDCGPTHYNACACREAYFAKLEARLKTAADAERVVAWIKDPYEPSHIHFTEGPERQIAYAVDELHRKLKLAEEALEKRITCVIDRPIATDPINAEFDRRFVQLARTALAELRRTE